MDVCQIDRSASSNYSGSITELTNLSHHTVSSSDYHPAPPTHQPTRSLREDLTLLKKQNSTFKQILELNPHLSQALNVSFSV